MQKAKEQPLLNDRLLVKLYVEVFAKKHTSLIIEAAFRVELCR